MKDVLLSIVIPVYNVEKYLEETLQSIICQIIDKKHKIEVLLINDGSTDHSGTICEQYAEKYPDLVKAYHKENEGLLLTRRYGFRYATGEYILNCDSDDTLEPGAIDEIVNCIVDTKADVIIFNLNMWEENSKYPFFADIFTKEDVREVSIDEVYKEYLQSVSIVSMCCKIFRRSCLDLNMDYSSYYKKSFGEDSLQSAEIYSNAKKIVYLNKQLYNYRYESGMTRSFNPTYYQDYKNINCEIEGYCRKWNLADFEEILSRKIFEVAARAVTQSRYNKQMTTKERIEYLTAIRNDDMLKKYEEYYSKRKNSLKRSYRMLLDLLFKEKYREIDCFLRIKNIVS